MGFDDRRMDVPMSIDRGVVSLVLAASFDNQIIGNRMPPYSDQLEVHFPVMTPLLYQYSLGCTTERHLSVLFTIVTLQNFTVTNDIRSTNNTGCVTTSILGQCSNSLPGIVDGIEAYNQICCVAT